MTSKKVWIGRAILSGVIIAIVASLSYLFVTFKQHEQSRLSTPAAHSRATEAPKADDSARLVKSAYEAYVKAAYDEKSPNPEAALSEFKKNMSAEGQAKIEYSKEKDVVLCTEGKPEDLSYTKPTILKATVLVTVVSALEKGTAQAVVTVDANSQKITDITCR